MSIEIEIVYNYLKEAHKELLELCHIDEDVQIVRDQVLENREVLVKQHKETSKGILDIYSMLKSDTHPMLPFIEELDNSRQYCYILLKVSRYVDDYLIEEIEEEIMSGAAEWFQNDEDESSHHVAINFLDPIWQCDLREYLKVLDKVFGDNNIGIFGISTHQ